MVAILIKNVSNLHQKYGKCLTLQQVTHVARLRTKGLQTLRKKYSSKLSNKQTYNTPKQSEFYIT
jgi:hypothetical protein